MTQIKIRDNDANQTIFNFIKKHYKETKLSIIYKWFRTGKIKINGKKVKDQKVYLLPGDEVMVYDLTKPVIRDQFRLNNYHLLSVVFEDDNILIADKPANLEVHSPTNENLDDMVKSYLFDAGEYDPENENSFVVSHVHRLDKLTSGLVIYAKNKSALTFMTHAIQTKEMIVKKYLARVNKEYTGPKLAEGYIWYDEKEQKSIFTLNNKNAFKECSMTVEIIKKDLLEITLNTGRKHQIRSILSYYGSPIQNDYRYNGKKVNNEREISLLAYKLIFQNITGEFEYLNGKEIQSRSNV